MENYDLKSSLDLTFEFLDRLNKFADETQPWVLIKTDENKTKQVLFTIAE
jgi:methionyl-tRNA synthetase